MPPLSDEAITLLEKRTEGWVAGLQLAALSLRDRADIDAFVHEFSGQNRYILDYLVEEVLFRQPPPIQRFLLHTSLLHSLTGALCDAVCQSNGSQKILAMLEKSNLFVVALDHQRHWYRYHQLFAEALRHRLQEEEPHLVPLLHMRAVTWYESQGMYNEVIEHALEAGETQFAATIVEQVAETVLLRGETSTVNGWLQALPAEIVRTRPLLSCIQAFTLLTQSRFEAVEICLLDVERACSTDAADIYTAEDLRRIQGMLHTARATAAINLGYTELAIQQAHEALTHLKPQDQALRAVVLQDLGDAYEQQGQMTEATRAFNEAFAIQLKTGSIFVAVTTLSSIGDIQAATGQLHQAASTYRQAIDLADTHTLANGTPVLLPPAGKALVLLSELLYEWNDLDGAEQAARQGNELCLQWTHLWHTIQGYLSLARILLAKARTEETYQSLDQAQHILDQARTANQQPAQPLLNRRLRWLAERITAQHISFLLIERKLDQARQHMAWLTEQIDSRTDGPSFTHTMAHIELALASRQPDQALQFITPLLHDAQRHGWKREQVDLFIRQALALAQRGEVSDALQSLAQALNLGEHARYMRTFLDKGPALLPLLQQAHVQAITPAYTRSILNTFAQLASTTAEELNAREHEVLHLLAAGLSNQAIAERLIIAPGTVKWYVHGIYSKLGVHSRTQALVEARKRRLLS